MAWCGDLMPPETLEFDANRLSAAGERFSAASAAIPQAPAPYVPTGSDPLAARIAEEAPKALAPVIEGLPKLKADTGKFASNVMSAAARYTSASQIATDALQRHQFDGGSGGTGGGAAPAVGTAPGAAAPAAATSAPGATGATQQAAQLGQLMQTPMQIASQVAQVPGQVMGAASSIPQVAAQAAQGVVQQLGSQSGDERVGENADAATQRPDSDSESEEAPTDDSGAAAAESHGEKVPESLNNPVEQADSLEREL